MSEMNGNPEYANIHISDLFSDHIYTEYMQSYDEGRDIGGYEALFKEVFNMPQSKYRDSISKQLFDMAAQLPQRKDYKYTEPNELPEIKKLRNEMQPCKAMVPVNYEEKLKGAWYGRIIGCLLGKPVEGIFADKIRILLDASDNYPLHRYMVSTDITKELLKEHSCFGIPTTWADLIKCGPIDDDTNYTVLSQVLISEFGRDFDSSDVAKVWLGYQPCVSYYTAEKAAYNNLINGFTPPDSAVNLNPFREWLGAQIRVDYYGYINPGNPELAAEMAWRDARVSHVKNGIYGAMFVAAMVASAAICNDISEIIDAGLGQIPSTSRLYEAVNKIKDMYAAGMSSEECFEYIHETYNEKDKNGYGWCHTLSNASIITASLLYSEGNAEKAICYAVQAGFDTDCNGATTGSIMGMRGGNNAFSDEWKAPIAGKLRTSIIGVGDVCLDDLVRRTIEHLKR